MMLFSKLLLYSSLSVWISTKCLGPFLVFLLLLLFLSIFVSLLPLCVVILWLLQRRREEEDDSRSISAGAGVVQGLQQIWQMWRQMCVQQLYKLCSCLRVYKCVTVFSLLLMRILGPIYMLLLSFMFSQSVFFLLITRDWPQHTLEPETHRDYRVKLQLGVKMLEMFFRWVCLCLCLCL